MAIFNKSEDENKKRLAEATRLLVEDERRFHEIFDRSAVGESIISLDGKWLDANERLCNILGYSRKELLNKHFADVTYPDDIKVSEEARKKLLAGESGSMELEKRYIQKNGNIIWVLLSIALYRNHDNNPHYFIAHTQDITELKKTEQQLYDSNEKFVTIFNLSPSLIAITRHSDGKIIDINESFTRLLGYSREEIIGRRTNDLKIWVDPAVKDNSFLKIKNIGDSFIFEADVRRKDGVVITVIDSIRLININGEACVVSVVSDITDRKRYEKGIKESEEKCRTIIDNVNYGVAIVQDFLAKFSNPKLLEITGYSLKEIQEKPFINFIAPEFVGLVKENYKKRTAGDEVLEKYEIEIIKKDGTRLPVEISGSAVNYEGKPGDMVFIADISERKKKEEEVLLYKFIIEQSNQQIGIADLSGNLLYVNESLAKNHGYETKDLIGKSVSILHPKEAGADLKKIIETLKEKGKVRGELVNTRKDGSKYITFLDNFIVNIDSKPKYMVGMGIDITELKNAEKEVEEQKSLLDSIVRSSNDGLLVIDKNGKVIFYNDKFTKLWNIPPNIIKARDDKKLLDYVMDQLSNPKEFIDKVNYLYKNPEKEDYETVSFKDGRVFDRISIPQKMGDDIVGRIWGFSDVTQKTEILKKEKERIEQMERINKLAVGRELKMVELKKEIENLKKKIKDK